MSVVTAGTQQQLELSCLLSTTLEGYILRVWSPLVHNGAEILLRKWCQGPWLPGSFECNPPFDHASVERTLSHMAELLLGVGVLGIPS